VIAEAALGEFITSGYILRLGQARASLSGFIAAADQDGALVLRYRTGAKTIIEPIAGPGQSAICMAAVSR
jgi:hypothetical protein